MEAVGFRRDALRFPALHFYMSFPRSAWEPGEAFCSRLMAQSSQAICPCPVQLPELTLPSPA